MNEAIHPRITVLIPVLNRADTLLYTLKTCIRDDYPNYEILISDNLSEDNFQEVIAEINDPRIRVVRPPKRLSMAEHWNFAIDYVDGGYLIIIGADDAVVFGGVSKLAKAIVETGAHAITWPMAYYLWPDTKSFFGAAPNIIDISLGQRRKTLKSKTILQKVVAFEKSYDDLPGVYHRCVSLQLLKRIKEKFGKYFSSSSPDVYLSLMMPLVTDTFVHLDETISINGISAGGNGFKLTTQNKEQVDSQLNDFYAEADSLRDPRFSHIVPMSVGIIENIEIAKANYMKVNVPFPEINYKRAFSKAIGDISATKSQIDGSVWLAGLKTVAKNLQQIEILRWLESINLAEPRNKHPSFLDCSIALTPYLNPRRRSVRFHFGFLENIYEAVIAYSAVSEAMSACPRILRNTLLLVWARLREKMATKW